MPKNVSRYNNKFTESELTLAERILFPYIYAGDL